MRHTWLSSPDQADQGGNICVRPLTHPHPFITNHTSHTTLHSYIFPACIIGGALLGLITVLADAVGVIGGGVGVMMTCSTLGTLLDVLENIPEWTGRPARKFQGND